MGCSVEGHTHPISWPLVVMGARVIISTAPPDRVRRVGDVAQVRPESSTPGQPADQRRLWSANGCWTMHYHRWAPSAVGSSNKTKHD